MVGGGVGDALGAPVEFKSLDEMRAELGPGGVHGYLPAFGRYGAITDDTQMAMFTAEGLLRAYACSAVTGTVDVPSVVGHAYLRWLHTQRESATIAPALDGWLVREKALFASRVPGVTVIDALRARTSFGERPRNTSKGCGGAMRVAPVGLWCARLDEGMSPDRIAKHAFELGADTAALMRSSRCSRSNCRCTTRSAAPPRSSCAARGTPRRWPRSSTRASSPPPASRAPNTSRGWARAGSPRRRSRSRSIARS